MFELIPAGTHIDFIGKRRIAIGISLALILAGFAALPIQGFRMGIDFAGGTEMQVLFEQPIAGEGPIRDVLDRCGVGESSVVRYGEGKGEEFLIRFRMEKVGSASDSCPLSAEEREHLRQISETAMGGEAPNDEGEVIDRLSLALHNGVGPLEVERVEFVGPRVGEELRRDGLAALGIACLLILVYIAFRFSARFAPGAVAALVHDILITAGIFVIFGMEFDLRVLAALLAILGYSLNDTIIVYDRIRENMDVRTKHDLVEVLNLSVNQTLSRTILTSGTTLVAVLALLFLGGEVLRPFAIAMTLGIVVGTYSSIYIAAPMLLFFEQRYGGERKAPSGAGAGAGAGASAGGAAASRTSSGDTRPARGKGKSGKSGKSRRKRRAASGG